ncbi:MAG: LPS-assembly protein LptD [Flavobacteriales bacterium]|nr:LPS-assembly protein LptD [Flavobacteriales bacterium]
MPISTAFPVAGREAIRAHSRDWLGAGAFFITGLLACFPVVAAAQGQTADRDTVVVADTASTEGLSSEVRYSALDSIRYDLDAMRVYLFGKAVVKYEDITLEADRIIYDFGQETVTAFPDTLPTGPKDTAAIAGLPRFTQGDNKVRADSLRYSFRTRKGYMREVRTQEDQAYVGSKTSKLHTNKEVHSKGGFLTTCDREKPHYGFRVTKMIVIPDDKIVAGPAYMRIGKVPTPVAIPFALFPNKRNGAAGILLPIYGVSDAFGYYFLNGGVYTPLGEKADLQLTGDIYTRGSWGARALLRYRTRYRYNGSFDVLHNTKLNGDPEFPNFSRERTFFVRWNHAVDNRASLRNRFNAQVNFGSSNSFTNNFNSSTTDYLSNTFRSNIGWTRLWLGKPFTLGVNATHDQNTQTGAFNITLPSISFNVQRVFPGIWLRPATAVGSEKWYERIGVNYVMNFDNRLATTEDQLSLNNLQNLTKDFRNGIRHSSTASTSFKTKLFTINPQITGIDRMYFETQRKTYYSDLDTTITDTVPGFANVFEWNARTDFTSKIYGMYSFRRGKLKAIRHVITPSVGFSYRPDQSTEIFGPFGANGAETSYSPYAIGIYGAPAAGASGLVSMSLQQSLEAKVARNARDTARPVRRRQHRGQGEQEDQTDRLPRHRHGLRPDEGFTELEPLQHAGAHHALQPHYR